MRAARILVLAAALLLSACAGGGAPPPNVILVVVDALRADHLSCYGYGRSTSPSIDSLAEAGTRWLRCTSQAPWTLPSFAAILSGTSVRSHGAGRREGLEYMLPGQAPYLPELLRRSGYVTYGHFSVAFVDERHGFSRGFLRYRCEVAGNAMADWIVNDFIEWADSLESDRPFFALLHLFDPHQPYSPPPPYCDLFGPDPSEESRMWRMDDSGGVEDPQNLEHYRALYDGEIAFADAQVGRLAGYIRERDLADRTVLVVMADHGEEFLEHGGVDHGHSLYQELIHVPLVISGPGIAEGRVDSSWVASMDVAPTLLEMACLEVPDAMEGASLLQEAEGSRPIPSSGMIRSREELARPWLCAVVVDGVKSCRLIRGELMLDLSTDLLRDPAEQSYSAGGDSALLDAYMLAPRPWQPVRVEADHSADATLRDIGYF